ncbi:hypothetical protein DPMN_172845 [Dreissena polymorpha]|uniref:Uncharacterized protein n=1 Tax=Dreissena polymorpha TaxID=45954 RepID=A0A9D4E2B7_DREPO|nr:hypothetical protein DPMN_172845 [Dreissena polymorpha]
MLLQKRLCDGAGWTGDMLSCSSSHCVNTFFVTVNNGGGGGGGVGGALLSDNHLVDGPTDRPTDRHEQSNIPPLLRRVGSDIIGTNLLTKFHEDWKINVASRVLTRRNAPPPGSHVFQPTGIIF